MNIDPMTLSNQNRCNDESWKWFKKIQSLLFLFCTTLKGLEYQFRHTNDWVIWTHMAQSLLNLCSTFLQPFFNISSIFLQPLLNLSSILANFIHFSPFLQSSLPNPSILATSFNWMHSIQFQLTLNYQDQWASQSNAFHFSWKTTWKNSWKSF
mgnify:CR=1 FL=1